MTLPISWSDPCDSLSAALVSALAEMPNIRKANKADLGSHKYTYADLADGLDAVRPVLARHGLAVLQAATTTEHGPTVVTTVLHTSGQRCSAALSLKPMKGDPQAVGSAITYARRYSLFSILGLATEDDDGKAASQPAPPPRPEPLDPAIVARFRAKAHEDGVDDVAVGDIVRAATNGRTANPTMVHADEERALKAAYARWIEAHPLPTEGTEP